MRGGEVHRRPTAKVPRRRPGGLLRGARLHQLVLDDSSESDSSLNLNQIHVGVVCVASGADVEVAVPKNVLPIATDGRPRLCSIIFRAARTVMRQAIDSRAVNFNEE